jgi:hypothetical protein
LQVKQLWIPCPDVRTLSAEGAAEVEAFRSGNQSELHTYLKFFALAWLRENSSHPHTVAPEVICYFPIPKLCEGVRVLDQNGREIDIRSPQVLYANREHFPLSYGDAIRVDLHSFDISVEVGGTQPYNLLMPMLEGLSDRAMWIPFPAGSDTSKFRLGRDRLSKVRAYSIEIGE